MGFIGVRWRVTHLAQIAAGAEGLVAGSCKYQHASLPLGLHRRNALAQLAQNLVGERVALFGAVDPQHGVVCGAFKLDHVAAHGRTARDILIV